MISFKPLLKTLIDKDMSKMDYVHLIKISSSTASKMWKNEYVAMKIVDDICNVMKCNIDDVIEHVRDK